MSVVKTFDTRRIELMAVVALAVVLSAGKGHAEAGGRRLLLAAVAAKEEALDSGRQQDWERALGLFQEAHVDNATAATAYEIGVAAAQLQRIDTAFEAYEVALQLGLAGDPMEKARHFIAEHVAQISRLILICPDGSRVFVRGASRGQVPLAKPLVLLPGPADIECQTTANEILRSNVVLIDGRQQVVTLEASQAQSPDLAHLKPIDSGTGLPITSHEKARPNGAIKMTGSLSIGSGQSSASAKRTAWALVGAGASLAILGTVYGSIASSQMDEGESALASACAEQVDGPDSCKHAKPGQQAVAQSHADSIATWRNVRAVSYVSAGLGGVALLGGAALFMGASPSAGLATWMPEVQLMPQQFAVNFRRKF